MSILIGILLFIFVLVALLLVLIILAQDDGTEGAGMIFGSAASQQYGAKKGNIITKTTSILATMFIIVAFSLSFLFQWNSNEVDISDTTQDTEGLEWWKVDTTEEQIPLEQTEDTISEESASEALDEALDVEETDTSIEEPVPVIVDTPPTSETMN